MRVPYGMWSLPLVGVRIEILKNIDKVRNQIRHSPWWECGLKLCQDIVRLSMEKGHSPWWECGLKLDNIFKTGGLSEVTPLGGSAD